MLDKSPLDVVLLVLNLLTLKDAFAVFATCRELRASEGRLFWVQVNVEMDKLPSAPGQPTVDYSTLDTAALRARAIRALRIHKAWRTRGHVPTHTHTVPVEYDVARIALVPWTSLAVLLGGREVLLQNWRSGATSKIPLPQYPGTLLCSARVFWVRSLNSNVLVVHLATTRDREHSQLSFFTIDVDQMSVSHLFNATTPPGLIHIDMREDCMALVCNASSRVNRIFSFHVQFGSGAPLLSRPTICVSTLDPLGYSSFAIVDQTRFLVAGPSGISLYHIPTEAFTASERTSCVPPLQTYLFKTRDAISSPPIGPVLGTACGEILVSVASGNFLRSLSVHGKGFRVTERRLVDRLPVYLGIASGFRVGVFRRPYSMPSFTTYSTAESAQDLHPFLHATDYSVQHQGSVRYTYAMLESLESGSLRVDEGMGVVMFVLRRHSTATAKLVVLELV